MIERIGDKSTFTHIGLEKAMAKYKSYDYSQRVMIPVSLEEQLVPGTLEFAIQTLVEDRMDMAVFEDRYRNDETGRMAYDPKILLKVVLLGYARGLVPFGEDGAGVPGECDVYGVGVWAEARITVRLRLLFPRCRRRLYLFFGMFCWYAKRVDCWGAKL